MTHQPDTLILIEPEKCSGCRLCQIACSMKHTGICSPQRSRIKIVDITLPESFVPLVCQACEDAPCIRVCPITARFRDDRGAVLTDDERCIGCRACLYICPFGTPVVDPDSGKTSTCDRCADDPTGPWCVAACREEKALKCVDTRNGLTGPAKDKAPRLRKKAGGRP